MTSRSLRCIRKTLQGAIGKVAIYDYLLSAAQIASHYAKMTGKAPNGSCNVSCTLN